MPKKTEEKLSPALAFIAHCWEHSLKIGGHSWTRLNQSMRAATELAITSGMQWDEGDFGYICEHFRPGYWMGETLGEPLYAMACGCGAHNDALNIGAAQSFEAWKERKPFILNSHRLCVGRRIGDCYEHRWAKSAAGDPIEWLVYPHAEVSSFSDTETVVVCSKYDAKESKWVNRPCRVWKLTRDDIALANKRMREAKKKSKQPAEEAAA